jgi:hypothetical protein
MSTVEARSAAVMAVLGIRRQRWRSSTAQRGVSGGLRGIEGKVHADG